MAAVVHILCALTGISCTVLLLRAYFRTRARLLLWSSLCFIGLAVNNALLFVDLNMVPNVDLIPARNIAALIGLSLLIYGLIVEAE